MEEMLLNDAYLQGVFLHEIFACALILPYICYVLALFLSKTFLKLNNRISLIFPITFLCLSVSLVTGIFLLAMREFYIDIKIAAMIFCLSLFLAGEIYRGKRLKKARISKEGMESYARFCKILYVCFLLLHICLVGLCKAL